MEFTDFNFETSRRRSLLKFKNCALLLILLSYSEASRYPTVLVVGPQGAGKSSLANVLLGRDKKADGWWFNDGCFKVGEEDGIQTTKKPCSDNGYLFGDRTKDYITVIDTPALDVNNKDIVDFVKNEHQLIDTILFVVKYNRNGVDSQTLSNLKMFFLVFGEHMWTNLVFATTFWKPVPQEGSSMNLPYTWMDSLNSVMKQEFQVSNISSVFIDTHFRQDHGLETFFYKKQVKHLTSLIKLAEKPYNGSNAYTADELRAQQSEREKVFLAKIQQLQKEKEELVDKFQSQQIITLKPYKNQIKDLKMEIQRMNEQLQRNSTTWKRELHCRRNFCFTAEEYSWSVGGGIFGSFVVFTLATIIPQVIWNRKLQKPDNISEVNTAL